MYWKMSIDLSRPLVSSAGQHDPLDGFVTYNELQATAVKGPEELPGMDLRAEIGDLSNICEGKNWTTDDPLGIGGLLFDACRVAQLIVGRNLEPTGLLENLLESSVIGLGSFVRENSLELPVDDRLAFRELGLSIGLRAVEKTQGLVEQEFGPLNKKSLLHSLLEALRRYTRLSEIIEMFWLERADTWIEHRDINGVMLATSLAPEEFLRL